MRLLFLLSALLASLAGGAPAARAAVTPTSAVSCVAQIDAATFKGVGPTREEPRYQPRRVRPRSLDVPLRAVPIYAERLRV